MKSFNCKFELNENMKGAKAPSYIKCEPFDAVKLFNPFEVIGQPISRARQVDWLSSCVKEDGGWVAFVCGRSSEQIKLFSYNLMLRYAVESDKLDWYHVTGSRWCKYLDSRDYVGVPHMIVLDSLLTHPPMHPNASRAYDPSRIGKIYDIVSKYRGQSSIVVMCPDLTPEEAHSICMVQPDMMFFLKATSSIVEL